MTQDTPKKEWAATIIVDVSCGLYSAVRCGYHFATKGTATKAYNVLSAAMKAYASRTNDREKFVEIIHFNGRATIDVANIVNLSVDYPDDDSWAMAKAHNERVKEARLGELPAS